MGGEGIRGKEVTVDFVCWGMSVLFCFCMIVVELIKLVRGSVIDNEILVKLWFFGGFRNELGEGYEGHGDIYS